MPEKNACYTIYTQLLYTEDTRETLRKKCQDPSISFHPMEELPQKAAPFSFLLTDNDAFFTQYSYCLLPVIAWQHPDNQNQNLFATPWMILDPEALCPEYLEEVWARFHHLPLQIASTPRLKIQELTMDNLSDLLALQQALSHCPDGHFFPADCPSPEEYLFHYINTQYSFFGFGIYALYSQDQFIGIAGYSQTEDPDCGNLSYAIHPSYQRQGYASEAISALFPLGSDRFGFQKVCAYIEKKNTPSLQLAQKCGIPYLLL